MRAGIQYFRVCLQAVIKAQAAIKAQAWSSMMVHCECLRILEITMPAVLLQFGWRMFWCSLLMILLQATQIKTGDYII